MNAESGSSSSGTFFWGGIAGIVVLAGLGGLYLSGMIGPSQEEPVSQTDVAVQTQDDDTSPEPAEQPAEITAEPEASVGDDTATAAPTTPMAPSLDQIFVEPDGDAVLSGSAEPGTELSVLLDGEPVHSFTVDPSGQFAEFLSIPFSDDAQGLTLETQGDERVRSDDYVIAALPEPKPADDALPTADTDEGSVSETEVAAVEQDQTGDQADEPAQTAARDAVEGTPDTPVDTQDQQDETQDQQVAILRSGQDGVELVQKPSAQPQESEQVALDTIGYSDAGEVELTGRVPDGSAVRLYLDNQLVDDLFPAEDGQWRSEIEGVEPGVYTLRVDEVASDGTVVSRLETPFKREPLEVLRAAEAPDELGADPDDVPIRSVTVQEGDTLWAISRERFGDGILYVKLFEANRDAIRDPDLIYPGQIFTIPE
ncbi:LysM peptidoglycan-binding domain-containing protein [Ruegeria sp. SCP11]|uniref:LysM peptidoglycan-binding domain-containing protein n=1 Tax=Ruegeria sp. SCP11 TaxID=3141378 RepID=UPI00333546EC